MIKLTIDEINRYVLPEKINFDNQTEILNKENYINLTKMLKFIENNGNIIKDFYNLKKKEFEDKYRHLNFPRLYSDLDNFLTKIDNYSKKWNLDKNFVIRNCIIDSIFRNSFVIDPKRQNPYETVVLNFLKQFDNLGIFEEPIHIPPNNKNSKYVYKGMIVDNNVKKTVVEPTPSIDFIWKYTFNNKVLNFYVSHKYTDGSGSAQKNQMKELVSFIDNANLSTRIDSYFIALMDGNYYKNNCFPNTKSKDVIYHYIRKHLIRSDYLINCDSYELYYIVLKAIKTWLNYNFDENVIKEEVLKLDILLTKSF